MSAVALVTGGTRGIGLGISGCLSEAGYDLAICGVRASEEVEPALSALRSNGNRALYVQADISDPSARRGLLEEIRKAYGRLDVLVNNAGVAPRERKDILEASEASFEWVLNINLRGPYFLTQSVARWMIEQKGNHPSRSFCVANVTSISATVASVNRGEYCISKAGLAMASKLWAVRLAEYGIPVWEIRPGVIETDMTAAVKQKYDELIAEGLMLENRWGTPNDIGKAVTALVSGQVPYSTGSVIMVDGGLTVERL